MAHGVPRCGLRWFRNTNESINDMLFLRKHAKLVRAVREISSAALPPETQASCSSTGTLRNVDRRPVPPSMLVPIALHRAGCCKECMSSDWLRIAMRIAAW